MKSCLRHLSRGVCVLAISLGFVAALMACFALIALVMIWLQEGTLRGADQQTFSIVAKWLAAASTLFGVSWWFYCRLKAADGEPDKSFRLVRSASGKPEIWVCTFSEAFLLVLVGTYLWRIVDGNGVARAMVTLG